MKNSYINLLVILSVAFLSFTKNNKKNINKNVECFLISMSDERMIDLQEGILASEKDTNKEIKEYGNLMIKDQTYLLEELKNFAKSKNIVLPKKISDKKLKVLNKLREKTGQNFDKKFLK